MAKAKRSKVAKGLREVTAHALSEARSLAERNRDLLKRLEALSARVEAHERELARQRRRT
jgi:hypothetical protein